MGKKSREILRARVDDVIADLTKAYADEWLAHYQYWLTARWIRSLDADTLRDILIEQSNDELGHAEKNCKQNNTIRWNSHNGPR